MSFAIRKLILCIVLFFAPSAFAQDQDAAWVSVAERAENAVSNQNTSLFAFTRIRQQLLIWRDTFAADRDMNSGRIATLDAQISALSVSEESPENMQIESRRTALIEQRAIAFAPIALASEAFHRADGLIRETDARISALERAALTTRGATPLNPLYWGPAIQAFWQSLTNVSAETAASIGSDVENGALIRNGPSGLLLVLIALGLLHQSGRRLALWRDTLNERASRWFTVQDFLISLARLIAPLIGITILAFGIQRLGVLGANGVGLLTVAWQAGAVLVIASWLTRTFFPLTQEAGPLGFDHTNRPALRRNAFYLGVGIALIVTIEGLMQLVDAPAISTGVLLFPLNVVMGVVLFRFGRLLLNTRPTGENADNTGGRRRLIGFAAMVVAIATPVLTGLGYASASNALFVPFVLSLGLIGILMLLLQLINTSWSLVRGGQDDERGPLAPVLIGIALILLASPVFAMIWGAGTTDLAEIWSRFKTGFTIGETTLSPSDFLTFLVLFAVGYLLTRFVQSSLRSTILPRTKLDLGGRNAVVAGVGYVGIILSAVIAITSAGIDLSNLALVAGALSVGIGFGLQNIVSNFVSGIILLIERPVGEGDWIEVNGQMGYVRSISVRSTRIETFDRTDVIIPNADLVSGQVTNWTRGNSVGRLIIPIGVAYGSDVEQVKEILKDIAMGHPMVLHSPEPAILFQNFGASSLDFEIRAILRDVNFMLSVKSEINTEIAVRFSNAQIEIPFPQQDIWVRQMPIADAGSSGGDT